MTVPHQWPRWPPASNIRAPQLRGPPDTHARAQKGGLGDLEECWDGKAAPVLYYPGRSLPTACRLSGVQFPHQENKGLC